MSAESEHSNDALTIGTERPMPEFGKPPVVEVALAVQFDPIDFEPAYLVDFAIRMRNAGFPRMEQHPPLPPAFEQIPEGDRRGLRVTMEMGLPAARLWYISEDDNRLFQLQSDRFVHNWRKSSTDGVYPRYQSVRNTFQQEFLAFTESLDRAECGPLVPNQVEVTYVNHIRFPSSGPVLPLSQVVRIVGEIGSDSFLPLPDDSRAAARFLIKHADVSIGRLHVAANYAIETSSGDKLIRLSLTARGAPRTGDTSGVLAAFDIGREWVVRGFADVTTPKMHEQWERKS